MLKQQGQNSLLVVSTPYTEKREVVDLEYTVVLNGRKPLFWLRHFLSKYLYEGFLSKEEIELINLLIGRQYHEIELGIQEGLLPLEAHSLNVLLKEINGKFVNFRNNASLRHLCPYIRATPFEYYGEKFQLEVYPRLKYRRREKRHHFQRYIGVGYKDKGAAKDVSQDGVPSWALTAGNIDNALEKLSSINREQIPVKEFMFTRKDTFRCEEKESILKKQIKYSFNVYSYQENPGIELWEPELIYGNLGFRESFDWDDLTRISQEINKTICPIRKDGKNCFVTLDSKRVSQWATFSNKVQH